MKQAVRRMEGTVKTYLISTTGSTTGYVSSNDAVTRALESTGGFRRCSRDEYEQHRRRLITASTRPPTLADQSSAGVNPAAGDACRQAA